MENRTDRATQDRGQAQFAAANQLPGNGASLLEGIETRMGDARDALTRADQSLRATVRERPFMAVGMALAVGYLISRGLARR